MLNTAAALGVPEHQISEQTNPECFQGSMTGPRSGVGEVAEWGEPGLKKGRETDGVI
jgi:hypothetical protein